MLGAAPAPVLPGGGRSGRAAGGRPAGERHGVRRGADVRVDDGGDSFNTQYNAREGTEAFGRLRSVTLPEPTVTEVGYGYRCDVR